MKDARKNQGSREGQARRKHSPRAQELEAQLQAMHDKADRYKQGLVREREAHGQTEAELVEERRFAFKAFCRLAKRLLRGGKKSRMSA